VYNQYVKGKPSVTVSVLTKGQEKAMAAADNHTIDPSGYKAPNYGYEGLTYRKVKDFDRSRVPGNGPNPVVKVPPVWTMKTKNGISVIGTQNTEIPTVTMVIKVPGGHLSQASDMTKLGLPDMTAAMMEEDTKNYTGEQMAVELQKLGSSISVSSGMDGMNFTVQSLKKNLDKTLALLEERMFNPNFTQDAFNRLQKQQMESFKLQKSQPAQVASAVWDKINYPNGNILGLSSEGDEKTVKGLKLEDVQNHYRDYMTSQGTKVVIVGDITQKEIEPKLAFLNKLPNRKVSIPAPPVAAKPEKTRIYLVDVPKAAQTEFRVGGVTNLRYDATGEYYRANLMNYPLGGSFNSILNYNLRETKGWTYGARSGFSGDEYTGRFQFSSGIKAEATDSALSDLMRDLKAYSTNGVKPEDLAFTKSAIGQRDALSYETPIQKAAFIGRIQQYNLPTDYVEKQNKILQGITKPEIDALAKKWIDTDRMNILLVGDKAKILPGLQKTGYEIVELDVEGNPKK
jgi:zinc protease